jgi:hypothetical protein
VWRWRQSDEQQTIGNHARDGSVDRRCHVRAQGLGERRLSSIRWSAPMKWYDQALLGVALFVFIVVAVLWWAVMQ